MLRRRAAGGPRVRRLSSGATAQQARYTIHPTAKPCCDFNYGVSSSCPSRPRRISLSQRKFLRRLLYTLVDVMEDRASEEANKGSESVDFEGEEGEGEEALEGVNEGGGDFDKLESIQARPLLPAGDSNRSEGDLSEPSLPSLRKMDAFVEQVKKPYRRDSEPSIRQPATDNIEKFNLLYDKFRQTSRQLSESLRSLGGGRRTANALHEMRRAFRLLSTSIQVKDGKLLSTQELPKRFHYLSESMDDIVPALWELTIFNSDLSLALLSLKAAAETAKRYLETEYNLILFREYPVDGFLNDVLWGSFTGPLETAVREMSHLAERHIQALHTSQERTMGKYLHLTTIATFLSSVTATTLQISYGSDDPSALNSATNTFWFCSLVFSIGSAMHSLLAMTWYQSAVRPTRTTLPPWLYKWFLKGPMVMLVLSGITFSIGLCLLAYGSNQDLATPVITTILATIITTTLFLLSGLFIKNQKLHRYRYGRFGDLHALQDPPKQWISALQWLDWRFWREVLRDCKLTTNHLFSNDRAGDTEMGSPDSPTQPSFPTEYPMLNKSQAFSIQSSPREGHDHQFDIKYSFGDFSAGALPTKELNSNRVSFLQFSANGKLLACLDKSCRVYSVTQDSIPFESNSVLSHPDGGEIEQVSWNPLYQMLEEQTLLTRSNKTICVWTIDDCLTITLRYCVTLDSHISAVQWSHKGAIIVLDKIIVQYDALGCVSRRYYVDGMKILDISPIQERKLLCLVQTLHEPPTKQLAVFDIHLGVVERTFDVDKSVTSMIVSRKANYILLQQNDSYQIWYIWKDTQAQPSTPNTLSLSTTITLERLVYKSGPDCGTPLTITGSHAQFIWHEQSIVYRLGDGSIVVSVLSDPKSQIGPSLTELHHFYTDFYPERAPPASASCFVTNPRSAPYMFVTPDFDGGIIALCLQSNNLLDRIPGVNPLYVNDSPNSTYPWPGGLRDSEGTYLRISITNTVQ